MILFYTYTCMSSSVVRLVVSPSLNAFFFFFSRAFFLLVFTARLFFPSARAPHDVLLVTFDPSCFVPLFVSVR